MTSHKSFILCLTLHCLFFVRQHGNTGNPELYPHACRDTSSEYLQHLPFIIVPEIQAGDLGMLILKCKWTQQRQKEEASSGSLKNSTGIALLRAEHQILHLNDSPWTAGWQPSDDDVILDTISLIHITVFCRTSRWYVNERRIPQGHEG